MSNLPSRTALAAALALALSAGAPVASAASTLVAAAQPSIDAIDDARANPNFIILQTGAFDPAAQQLDVRAVGAAADALSAYAIVQFQAGQVGEQKALAARGVQLLGYVPNNAYFVRLNGVALDEIRGMPAVRWAGPLRPAMKLDPALWSTQRATSAALKTDGRYEIVVQAFQGVSSAKIQNLIAKAIPDAEFPMRSMRDDAANPYVRVNVPASALDALIVSATAIDGVSYVSPWVDNTINNAGGIGALQGNLTGTATCNGSGPICGASPMFDHGLTGTGQIAAVADSGTTPNAAWFATLDKGNGPHTAVTFAENPAPIPPAIGTLHEDNKIIAYWTQPGGPVDYDYISSHGTHTTGTVVGDAAGTFGATTYMPATPLLPNHDLADGMAPGAQLLMQDIGGSDPTLVLVQDLEATLRQAWNGGARVHNNSWGGPTQGQYTANDANVDRVTRDHEDLLVVISAGNDRAGARQTGSPGNAKNAVTIAALGHAGNLAKASYSNAGPAADGRLKPDIAAPGTSVISAKNSTAATPVSDTVLAPQTKSNTGTSMAAPTVTGNAVLLRQYFTDGFYPRGFKNRGGSLDLIFADGFDGGEPPAPAEGELVDTVNPTGAVLKAVLLNSTVATTSPTTFPNTGTGWGRPWLDGNLWFRDTMPGGDDSRRLRVFERTNGAGLRTGDANEYTIANVSPGIEFRATLTWFDPPAQAGTASSLVNNLDLEVVAPDGQTYLGNRFSGNVSVTGGSPDAKDTVEQVRFTAPVAGSYTIRVKATNVPGTGELGTDQQGYGLAVSGAFGLPDATPFAAPTAPAVSTNGTSGIGVGATVAKGAQSFQLYRAEGTCATAKAGDFHLVANGTTLPLTDTKTQGGYSYAYKLRGVSGDVEGEISDCVDVVSQDECTLTPTFDRDSLGSNGSNATCSVNLNWSAAQSNCPTNSAITYKIERDTNAYFTAPQTLDAALSATTYTDTTVSNGTPYFYRVTASDAAGNPAPASRTANATPSGVDGPDPGAYLDDVDTHSYAVLAGQWQVTDTGASAGTYSYRVGGDDLPYPDLACVAITTPALKITAGSTLSFKAKYDLEYQFDGITQEISTDGGATWTDLPPDGGYPSSFALTENPPINQCGYVASHGAFSGVSTAASNADPGNGTAVAVFKPFTANLASYAGQTAQIRWRLSSDPNTGFSGFFIDEVKIDGAAGSGDYMCH